MTRSLRTVGRYGRTAAAGAHGRLWLGAVLGVIMLIGHLGIVAHQYEHLGEVQPEVVCHLCAAGDHFTPLPAAARVAPPLQYDAIPVRSLHVVATARPLRTAHGVRAPPRAA